jgi:hypothetical protein
MPETKTQNKVIRLQIIEAVLKSFKFNKADNFDLSPLSQEDLSFDVEINVASNLDEKRILLLTTVVANLKKSNTNVFDITSEYIFQTEDIKKVINEQNAIIAPEDFMRKIINITIGGIRGMLAVKLIEVGLEHITLPLMDTSVLEKNKKSRKE